MIKWLNLVLFFYGTASAARITRNMGEEGKVIYFPSKKDLWLGLAYWGFIIVFTLLCLQRIIQES